MGEGLRRLFNNPLVFLETDCRFRSRLMPAIHSFSMSPKERCPISALVDFREVRRVVPAPIETWLDARDGGVQEEWERTSVATGDAVADISRERGP